MSAEWHRWQLLLLCASIACGGMAAAADDELPDPEFLEYLGSWEESDEDWLLFDELTREPAASEEKERSESETASAPDPAVKESTESDR